MAEPRRPDPVLLIVAAFSRHDAALAWGGERLAEIYNSVAFTSPPFEFRQTSYYEPTMGPGLRKRFFVFEKLVEADCMADVKRRTNALEQELMVAGLFPEPRPLNLDPGILSLGKFQLATTKDQAHRIYLRDGIFAEVTLRFEAREFVPWPWTYADYREPDVRTFLKRCRDFYRQRLRAGQ